VLEHHQAHAASAYFPSPFDDAVVLVLDRGGDFRCGSRWLGHDTELALDQEQYSPDSLGQLYSRVTELLGFHANSEEHKVQWLSVTGDDRFVPLFRDIIRYGNAGPRLDGTYFSTDRLTHGRFSAKFYDRLELKDGEPVPGTLAPHVAAGIQRAVEECVIQMAGSGPNVCLAGGLGLNALLVSALEHRFGQGNVFVQPAAGNAGTAIGAVLEAWHGVYREARRVSLDTVCLGPAFTAAEIKQVLENCKLRFRYFLTADELTAAAVAQFAENRIVAWMHGRMEFGARALGNRSILASPMDPYSTENLNAFIKHREQFRKFAASVPAEMSGEYFDVGANARFLATVGRVRPQHRDRFAAAVLTDDLVRIHAVDRDENPLYWKLLHEQGKATGLPVLYNTSFNLFGEPLVCTPRDAVRSFYSSGIDAMFVGHFFLQK
jgi:carbamoyltransferase